MPSPSGPIAEAPVVAAALQNSAAAISPYTAMSVPLNPSQVQPGSVYGDADTLGAGTPSKPSGPAAREELNKPKHAVVPASVTNAAAALAQQLRSNGQIRWRGSATRSSALVERPVQARGRQETHGKSVWNSAPPGVTPEMRIAVELPSSEFTYIERPWSHFSTRWAAIDQEMDRFCTQDAFSVIDLGSCHGFFSLQAASAYRSALIVGVEGSVGVGNGTTGLQGKEDDIIATKAVQTHLQWAEKLELLNCLLAPEVWDFHRVCSLSNLGRPICNVMFNLSVVHHIDGISEKQYLAAGLSAVEGTVTLMSKLLLLGNRHFIELPDAPWIEHVWNTFRNPREFLEAAARASGMQWSFTGPLVTSAWYGHRELWLMEAVVEREVIPAQGLRALFPRILGPKGNEAWIRNQAWPTTMTSASVPPGGVSQASCAPQTGARSTETRPEIALPPGATSYSFQEQLGAALLAAPTALIAAHVQMRDSLKDAVSTLQDAPSMKMQG